MIQKSQYQIFLCQGIGWRSVKLINHLHTEADKKWGPLFMPSSLIMSVLRHTDNKTRTRNVDLFRTER